MIAQSAYDVGMDVDLVGCGLFFNDLTFTGLHGAPELGHEHRVGPYRQTPGGIANSCIAAARLGIRVAMVADTGDDQMSVGALSYLNGEGVDTSHCLVHEGWQTPLTVILNYEGDRAMVTSETRHPGPCVLRADAAPRARVAITHLQPFTMPWLAEAAAHGTLVVGDTGDDESEAWDLAHLPDLGLCHAFTPNLLEATHYTRTTSGEEAVRALASRVPLPIVTMGAEGVLAVDPVTGRLVHVPSVKGPVVNTCGAGDVFNAALAASLLTDWPLESKLRFASLAASLTVAQTGGATSAPTLGELQAWALHAPRKLAASFAFLAELDSLV